MARFQSDVHRFVTRNTRLSRSLEDVKEMVVSRLKGLDIIRARKANRDGKTGWAARHVRSSDLTVEKESGLLHGELAQDALD
ncbi:hypothetical protein TNCV_3250521 [Trichonephila clavipes]|nr:hypothetical protein TNCV_3250521 [Trichonephila clavipes]